MATPPKFNELALQYVLADQDEKDRLQEICEQAAEAIEESTNRRTVLSQWVASISRWMQSDGDEDLISRGKAFGFLAGTLEVLSKRHVVLSDDQTTLLVTFFASLFDNDHRAGIMASAKALRYLVAMKNFQPRLADLIFQSISNLGEDFKLQTPATRLEIYDLFQILLKNPAVVSSLESQHGNKASFVPGLINLCRSERDPENLIIWFAILSDILQLFNPSDEITSEIFKAFSAYFPISLRPSATPSAVTTDDLKTALRSCFAAHHRLAGLAIPFLVDKLDKVDQTVAVKVDILLTLDACLTKYDHPEQTIGPYADQIWGSLKYEVRNGEIPDNIKATLKVLSSLTRRLDGDKLRSFLDNAWIDMKEDISDSKYTSQAGRLLIAITGASPRAFGSLMPRGLEHVKRTAKQTTSDVHKRHLMALLSSMLKLRLALVSDATFNSAEPDVKITLCDELFGDSLLHDFYLPFWNEHSDASAPVENIAILQETMDGLGALVGQKSSLQEPSRLCSDSSCDTVFSLLAKPVIVQPLEGPKFIDSMNEIVPEELFVAGKKALINAVPLYPRSLQYLLLQYLASVKAAYKLHQSTYDLALRIRSVSATLCAICASDNLNPNESWFYETTTANAFLQGLHWMLSKMADPFILSVFVDAIHEVVKSSLKKPLLSEPHPDIIREWFDDFAARLDAAGVPQIDQDRPGRLEAMDLEDFGDARSRRAYGVFVVQQIYRRFTIPSCPPVSDSDGTPFESSCAISLSKDLPGGRPDLVLREDLLLNRIGQLAITVVRVLSQDEQQALNLGREAFNLFHTGFFENGLSTRELGIPFGVSPADEFRTVPLSLGVVQALRPEAIDIDLLHTALGNLTVALVSLPMPCSDRTRAVMDTLFAVLSNKFLAKKDGSLATRRAQVEEPMMAQLRSFFVLHTPPDTARALRVFRSILHYLAGKLVSMPRPGDENELLNLVVRTAPSNIMMGREFARNLGLMMAPRECLTRENHALRRALSAQWLYYNVVSPNLNRCFPNPQTSEREAVNRAVAFFSMARYVEHDLYVHDVPQIVRVAIRSLATFKVGTETETLLVVLLNILERSPNELKEHLSAVIPGVVAIYGMARNVADAEHHMRMANAIAGNENGSEAQKAYISKSSGTKSRNPIPTRVLALRFLRQLTQSGYEPHLLLPHRKDMLRPLALACGDTVREIRRAALEARQAWADLD